MAYDIGPRIGIKGEKEFNSQIERINNGIRECGSEMNKLSSEFEENANSQEALIAKNKNLQKQLDLQKQKYQILEAQQEKQKKKLSELREAYDQVSREQGENSKEAGKLSSEISVQEKNVSKLSVAMNETESYMNKLTTSMKKNDTILDQIEQGARDAAAGYSELDDKAKKAGDQLDAIEKNTKAEAMQGLADGISAAGDAMKDMVENSKEYLQIMGQLEASSQRLGYLTQETEQTYAQLYGVLGDQQTAATATANLQALGLSQQDLTEMTELAIGAWAQYGDSIPIDGLAEAINETAQTGVVTGTFADALNWAGISEDAFNKKLESTTSESERAKMIMEVLKSQGLDGVAQGYRDANGALIASNEAQAQYDEAMSQLAEIIMPAVTGALQLAADALSAVAGFFQSLPEPVQKVIEVIGIIIVVLGALAPVILTVMGAVTLLNASMLPMIGIIAAIVAAIVIVIAVIQNWGAIVEWFQGIFKAAGDWIKNTWESIKQWFDDGVGKAIDAVAGMAAKVINFFRGIIDGAKENIGKIGDTIKNGFKEAIDFITSLPGKALEWGKDFIQGLIDGIKSMIGKIGDAAKSIANKISNFLHFSRPEEGPLHEYETWMPDFLSGMAKGIYQNIGKIEKAASAVSGTIESTIRGEVGTMAESAAVQKQNMIVVEGDSIILEGKVIGRTATKYISAMQGNKAAAKGKRMRYV